MRSFFLATASNQKEQMTEFGEREIKSLMEPQVDFLRIDQVEPYDSSTNVEKENIELRKENQRLLGQFCQQIHDIQREKEAVRQRLIAAESDYDAQMQELKFEIMNLRDEVASQKRHHSVSNREHQDRELTLVEQNTQLTRQLEEATNRAAEATLHSKEMQNQLQTSRATISSLVHQLDGLRSEMTQLREDKESLEKRLKTITDERDCLLNTLSDAQQANELLQQENSSQHLVISRQDSELVQLEQAAALLRDQLETIDAASSSHRLITLHALGRGGNDDSMRPHQSLLGELSIADGANEDDQWWYKHVQLDPTMSEFYEDDGIEIDEASLLANMLAPEHPAGRHSSDPPSGSSTAAIMEVEGDADGGTVYGNNDQAEFLGDFRTEVAEIYQQLRQMCVAVSAQSSASMAQLENGYLQRGPSSSRRPGDWTPDQLARVEWDFRLASLRNVLTDLRGLLQDLITFPPNYAPTTKP